MVVGFFAPLFAEAFESGNIDLLEEVEFFRAVVLHDLAHLVDFKFDIYPGDIAVEDQIGDSPGTAAEAFGDFQAGVVSFVGVFGEEIVEVLAAF